MARFQQVDMPQAHVAFLLDVSVPPELMEDLIINTPWQQPTYNYGGGPVPQPRLSCWMGDAGATYKFSGKTYEPVPWHPQVAELRALLAAQLETPFNSCLLNYYRDHNDSVSYHADDEPELGAQPTIAAISLGAQREIHFKNNHNEHPKVKLPLPPNSTLVMWGRTQQLWKHSIPKQKQPCGPRVSLTFREILTNA